MITLQLNHHLHDVNEPWGRIQFKHADGSTHEFYSFVNSMTGDRLSAVDGEPPTIGDLPWVKLMFRNIKKHAEVTGLGGKLAESP
jgi:hypothetical protein